MNKKIVKIEYNKRELNCKYSKALPGVRGCAWMFWYIFNQVSSPALSKSAYAKQ